MLGTTIHYIDSAWKLVNELVCVTPTSGARSASNVATQVKSVIDSVTCDDTMLSAVVRDGASAERLAGTLIVGDAISNLTCVSHTLKLISKFATSCGIARFNSSFA